MATSAPVTTSFGKMTVLTQVSDNTLVPVLANGNNYTTTIGVILSLVSKQRIGLGNVENLAPADLPISRATQQALDGKLANNGTIQISQVEGLGTRLTSLETGSISINRITDFDVGVNSVIDSRTDLIPSVVQGEHSW